MPSAARRPCTWAGCAAFAEGSTSRCTQHKRQVEVQRGTAHERGYTSAWTKARQHYLNAHPLCARHQKQGQVVAATVVDHIKAHKGDKALFWDSTNNWQPLCKPCHDHKTATEDGGFGRRTPPGGRPNV